MPEMPEVETIRRDLQTFLAGKTFSAVEILDIRVLTGFGPDGRPRRRTDAAAFGGGLRGQTITSVDRRGKYLMFHLSGGGAFLSHLRMTGQWIWGEPRAEARARFRFAGAPETLSFCDTRRFGELWLAGDWRQDRALKALGPEPLTDMPTVEVFAKGLRRSSAKMQSALLDQKRLAGLGNIYVTEALFLSGIRPTRRGHSVRAAEVPGLLKNIRKVLEKGLTHRGVSFSNYRDARGEKGQAKDRLLVYGKAEGPCPQCRTVLRAIKVGGRGTVFCPACQK